MFSYRTKREAEQLKAARVARDKAYQTELRALRKMVRESAKVQADQLARVKAYQHTHKYANPGSHFEESENEHRENLRQEIKANEPYSAKPPSNSPNLQQTSSICNRQGARRRNVILRWSRRISQSKSSAAESSAGKLPHR